MQRSSETIGAIAAALAKAQAELSNPEKSLVATIVSSFPREADRTFRYAPLSSGLDIVRKCLGRHEIATVQTTAIDGELVRLTTILAHSSGEWVSSEWPVCPVGETAAPHRMGAALTYARRYALFTLVGIAGEDDLDAPDLSAAPKMDAHAQAAGGVRSPNGHAVHAPGPARVTIDRGKPLVRPPKEILPPDLSAALREQMVVELGDLKSADDAADWAHRSLPMKNTLTAADADVVESEFRATVAAFDPHPGGDSQDAQRSTDAEPSHEGAAEHSRKPEAKPASGGRARLTGKTIRLRDKEHRKFVSRQPCVVCGRTPSDPHHLRFAQPRALGTKVSDEFTIPVCRLHHRELHRQRDEAAWWNGINIDPIPVALALWQRTRGSGALGPLSAGVRPQIETRENIPAQDQAVNAIGADVDATDPVPQAG